MAGRVVGDANFGIDGYKQKILSDHHHCFLNIFIVLKL